MTTIKAGNDDNNKEEPKKAEGADAAQPTETTEQQPAAEQDNKPVIVPAPEETKTEDVKVEDAKVEGEAIAGATPVIPGDNVQAEPAAVPAPKKKGWLGFLFNAACCGGAGFVVGSAVKAGLAVAIGTTVGAQVLTVAVGAVAIGAASTAAQRALDIRAYNKEHADAKLSYTKDFFKATATGHDTTHYRKRLMISSAFALGGGFLGLMYGDKIAGLLGLGGDPAPVTTTTPDVQMPAQTLPDTANVTPPVEANPVVNVPAPEGSTEIANTPPAIIGDGTVTPEATPEVAPEKVPDVAVTPDTTPEATPEATPEVAPEAVVQVPSFDSRLQDVLQEAYGQLPAKPGSKLAETMARISSDNVAVKAQAIKDLGYFFANGFARLPENDARANKLFGLSVELARTSPAAETALEQALHDLGYQTMYGKGTGTDIAAGRKMLEEAAKLGNRLSIEMLKGAPALKM